MLSFLVDDGLVFFFWVVKGCIILGFLINGVWGEFCFVILLEGIVLLNVRVISDFLG